MLFEFSAISKLLGCATLGLKLQKKKSQRGILHTWFCDTRERGQFEGKERLWTTWFTCSSLSLPSSCYGADRAWKTREHYPNSKTQIHFLMNYMSYKCFLKTPVRHKLLGYSDLSQTQSILSHLYVVIIQSYKPT